MLRVLLLILVLSAAGGCHAVNDRYWGFPVGSRLMEWGTEVSARAAEQPPPSMWEADQREFWRVTAVLAFFCLPLDLLALIVTIPHDIYVQLAYDVPPPGPRWRNYAR